MQADPFSRMDIEISYSDSSVAFYLSRPFGLFEEDTRKERSQSRRRRLLDFQGWIPDTDSSTVFQPSKSFEEGSFHK